MGAVIDSFFISLDPAVAGLIIKLGIALIAASGLQIVTGLTGQVSLGQAGFFNLGALIFTALINEAALPAELFIVASGIGTALAGALCWLSLSRLSKIYFFAATALFTELVRVGVALGGDYLPLLQTGSWLSHSLNAAEITTIAAFVLLMAVYLIKNSRFGRALIAVREDEALAQFSGISPVRYKLQAFATGSFFMGVSGALFVYSGTGVLGGISSVMGFEYSLSLLNMVVLGGLGSVPGTVIGAVLLTFAQGWLKSMGLNYLVFSIGLFVLLTFLRPQGLLGSVKITRLLKPKT